MHQRATAGGLDKMLSSSKLAKGFFQYWLVAFNSSLRFVILPPLLMLCIGKFLLATEPSAVITRTEIAH